MKPFLAVALVLFATNAASAQTYPSRPIPIIAPTTAGGPPDTIARLLSEPMRAVLGQPIVVENVTGAGSTLGVGRVARSAPDGYTLSIGHLNSHVFSSLTYPVAYDVVKDFEPISLLTTAPMALFGRSVAGIGPGRARQPGSGSGQGIVRHFRHRRPARVWATDFRPPSARDSVRTVSRRLRHRAGYRRRPDRHRYTELRTSVPSQGGKLKATPSRPTRAGRPRRRFQPSKKPACLDFRCRSGTPFGRPKARHRM